MGLSAEIMGCDANSEDSKSKATNGIFLCDKNKCVNYYCTSPEWLIGEQNGDTKTSR